MRWSLTVCASLTLISLAHAQDVGESIEAYRSRMRSTPSTGAQTAPPASGTTTMTPGPVRRDEIRPAGAPLGVGGRAALVASPATPGFPPPLTVLGQIPDPEDVPQVFQARLAALRDVPRQEPRVVTNYERVVKYAHEYLEQIHTGRQAKLGLRECIERALRNNYAIKIESFNPAISQTQIVEAEAAFDAEFFLDYGYSNRDNAVATDFDASKSDSRNYSAGIRQLFPTGMTASTRVTHARTFTDFQFQVLNPAYQTNFIAEFRQPILRGFGLDVNRAQINIRKVEREIATETFIQQVRDALLDVETAYWRLAQARRAAAILAESVAQNRVTYEGVLARKDHDATEVEIQNSKAGWNQRVVEFVEAVRNIRQAEDELKGRMNDPEFPHSDLIEIIPVDIPIAVPLAVDQFADARAAIDNRSEIRAVRRGIDVARINTAVAKNQLLPQLDVTFQYEVQGVEGTADESLDRLTTNRFRSYTVGVNLAVPIGNRAREAAHRRARTQEAQAVVRLRQILDNVILEVNTAVRQLIVRYTQIPPQFDAVTAAERNLRALQARTQRIDPAYLDTELRAVEQLNNTRTILLQIVTEYNTAIVQLERAKGTLLKYNNVVIADAPAGG